MSNDISEIPGASLNFRTELARQLGELVPEAIADGKVDVAKLKELLDDDYGDESERFGLFWPGKKRALRAAQEPTTATLKPMPSESKDWDTTQNVYIEGDNLEVLKILQNHYHNKIKMIYIDPPYNTGKDFIYPDNYIEGLSSYLEFTRQVDEEGRKLHTNAETEGRYHSNWLNMMYPRLKLARNLLTDDGVIFISIDDHEVANLRLLLDNIFGESNFIENYIWESNFRPDNSSRVERENAQHVLCYARNRVCIGALVGAQKTTDGLPSLTKSSMKVSTLRLEPQWVEFHIPDGKYEAGDKGSGYVLETDVTIKNGRAQASFDLTGRVIWSQPYLETQVAAGTKIVIKSVAFVPYSKKLITSVLAPTTLIPKDSVADVLAGNAEIKALFGKAVFNHPKPTTLLMYLIRSITDDDKNAVVCDFFSGSGTTAHAVMQLNSQDSGSRRFIQIQLPEPTPADSEALRQGFKTIPDIGRKRIDLAGDKIKAELETQLMSRESPLDIGYRTYKLVDTNFPKWRVGSDVDSSTLRQELLGLVKTGNSDSSSDDLLTELLLKQGYSLTERIASIDIDGISVRSVGDSLLLAYLDTHIKPTLGQLRALAEIGPVKLVVLDDVFQGDDELKTNLVQICKSKDIELWTA